MADEHYWRGLGLVARLESLLGLGPGACTALGVTVRKPTPWKPKQLCFPEHGLVIEPYGESYVHKVYLSYTDGREDLEIFKSCEGGFGIAGPHWDYIERVFIPWVNEKIDAYREKNAQARAQKEHEARVRLAQNVSDWARDRVIPTAPLVPRGLDELLDEDRADLRALTR